VNLRVTWWRLAIALVAVPAAYAGILSHPQPLFAYHRDVQGVHVHSRRVIDSRIDPLLEQSLARVRRATIYDPAVTYDVVEAGSPAWYGFFNGPFRGAMARHSELGGIIFVPRFDVGSGLIRHFDGREAPLVEVLAHEMVHRLMQTKLGLRRTLHLQWWKREGYAELIAEQDTVPLGRRLGEFESPSPNGLSIPRRHLEALIAARYLFEVRHLSYDDYLALDESLPTLWASIPR
jgi:hypothetical protein